jgi:isopentenyl phosphate kinase
MIDQSASNVVYSNIVYVKLGGSLITDKRQAETPRLDVIQRLAAEIAAARAADPSLRLIVGHGSGSFGHVVGSRYGTRSGVRTSEGWYGFAATADAAARLNRIVTAALLASGIPAWSIQPGVALRCQDGVIVDGPAETVRMALARGLVPLVHGDVALDRVRGGTIASTEEIFEWLAQRLPPRRMVLAGEVDGVYTGDPLRDPSAQRIPQITPQTFAGMAVDIGDSFGTDVTGGMAAKVRQALRLAQRHPQLQILLCSGLIPGAVQQALAATQAPPGTVIYS